jgi:hypothetical protein
MGVAEVARRLGIDRDLVKQLSYCARDHLTASANPSKGTPRRFAPEDLPVLVYAAVHWEDTATADEIVSALARGEHRQPRYMNWRTGVTPLFQDIPETLNDTWRHGAVVGGPAARQWDKFALASSFKLAGDALVDSAVATDNAYELVYPILYSYRHAVELYLKAILPSGAKKHSLAQLLNLVRRHVTWLGVSELPMWFQSLALELDDFDPRSTAFRYGEDGVVSRKTGDEGEFWMDLQHLRKRVDWFADACRQIRQTRP